METYSVVLADDEPLVLAGLCSILDWKAEGLEIVGTARNGRQLLETIDEKKPDIVISDVRMPLMTGLEVMQEISDRHQELPLFILLSGYEEFSYVREAISLNAVEYLVKLDLSAEVLSKALEKARRRIRAMGHAQGAEYAMLQNLRDRFYVRLVNGLIPGRQQFEAQCESLGIKPRGRYLCAALVCLEGGEESDRTRLFIAATELLQETLSRQVDCQVIPFDLERLLVICFLHERESHQLLYGSFSRSFDMLEKSFSLKATAILGPVVEGLYEIGTSYTRALETIPKAKGDERLLFVSERGEQPFALASFQSRLFEAFSEVDGAKMNQIFHEIAHTLEQTTDVLSAISACSQLVSMVIAMVPDGHRLVEEIFRLQGEDQRNLYRFRSTALCSEYLRHFGDGLEKGLQDRRQDWRAAIVHRVQAYIKANLDKRLSLSEVAALFGFSQNYLSTLFSRYANIGFVEYTTGQKMEKAKALMATGNWKIYELACQLGYEDSSYFSKVFKQHEGMSPREYAQSRGGLVDEL